MTLKKTILIVDDEPEVREIVRRYMEAEGYRVIEADSGPAALGKLYEDKPDLVILDVMLPGLDGFTVTRSLRDPIDSGSASDLNDVPIILLTARTDEPDRIAGFELGADDYVTKPFSPRELVMRVRAVLRRGQSEVKPVTAQDDDVVTFGDVRLEPSSRLVKKRGETISLTAKEFELLWYLARNPNRVYTRAQLLDQIWGYDYYGDDSTVTVHIHRLREKIEDDPANPIYIHTVWGVGYKFEDQ